MPIVILFLPKGKFSLAPGEHKVLAAPKVCTTQKRMLLIKWQLADGSKGCNHALCGNPQFDFDQYLSWLPKIAELDNSFKAGNIGCPHTPVIKNWLCSR